MFDKVQNTVIIYTRWIGEMKVYKILALILIAALLIVNVSCSKGSGGGSVIPTDNIEIPKQIDIELMAITKNITTAINDDIWYKGTFSWFKNLEKQELPVEIFRKHNNNIYVLLEKTVKVADDEVYIAIEFLSVNNEYSNKMSSFIIDADINKVKMQLDSKGYKLYKKAEVELDEAIQPEYPITTDERKKIIEVIEKELIRSLKEDTLFPKGAYKIYIRNFRDNDFGTKAVIESLEGETWLRDVSIDSENRIALGRVYTGNELKSMEYEVSQYKKVAILEMKVNSEDMSNSTQDVNKIGDTNVNQYHPVIIARKRSGGSFSEAYVIGGSKDGKWYKLSDFNFPEDSFDKVYVDIDLVKGGETYKLYSSEKLIATVKGEKPTYMISAASGNQLLQVKMGSLNIEDNFFIGVNGDWNALPRALNVIESNVYSVDLDNDGKEEILRLTETPSNEANSSDSKDVQLTVEADGKSVIVGQETVDGIYVSDYLVFAIDLNGDGKLEIIIAALGHNTSLAVIEFADGQFNEVLNFYNGD